MVRIGSPLDRAEGCANPCEPMLLRATDRWPVRVAVLGLILGLPTVAWASGEDGCEHRVSKGDTLSAIAVRHGVGEKDLIESNASLRENPDLLRIGQTLDICAAKKAAAKRSRPGRDGGSKSRSRSRRRARRCGKGGRVLEHEVRSGQTLGAIAAEHGVGEKDIIERNESLRDNPNMLRVGQTLEVCVEERRITKSKLCNYNTPLHRHEVVPGEHLGQIAGRYGVRRSDLMRWNPALRKNPNMLRVGSHLQVCPEIAPRERTRIEYTVQSGDTLGSIADGYDLTMRELERFQQGRLADVNALREGQSLVVWVDGGIVDGFGSRDTDRGVLKGGIQLPDGRHYHVKWKAAAWGTASTVRSIQSAIASYKRRVRGGPKIHVGDLSKRSGGRFPPHISHQHGRDVDIGYVLQGKDADVTRFRTATSRNLDVGRTWRLIKAFIDTDNVTYIFMDYSIQKLLYEHAREHGVSEETLDELFQYPRGRGRSHGIIRHWRGHKNHFHVRFRK